MPDPLTPTQFAFLTRHVKIDGDLLRAVFAVEQGPVSREDLRGMREHAEEIDLDLTEFDALSDICDRLEDRLTRLLGPANALVLPATATDTEAQDLTRLAEEARTELGNTRPKAALALIDRADALCRDIEQRRLDEIERLAREEALRLRREKEARALKEMKDDIAREVGAFRKNSPHFASDEWAGINKLAAVAVEAAKTDDAPAIRKALVAFLAALDKAREDPGDEIMVQRFLEARKKGDMAVIAAIYLECRDRAVDLSKHIPYGFDRQVDRFLNPPRIDPNFARVDFRTGEPHARQRHTRRGIHAAGAVLTAHPTRVSIFADEAAFADAKRKVPLARNRWTASSDRLDCTVDGVHYQALALFDTLSITSFYPVGGKDYAKADVARLLDLPYVDFCDELDKL